MPRLQRRARIYLPTGFARSLAPRGSLPSVAQVGADDVLRCPTAVSVAGHPHEKEVEVRRCGKAKGQSHGDKAVLRPPVAMQVDQPLVAHKGARGGLEPARQREGELKPVPAAVRGGIFTLIPAPFGPVATIEAEGWRQSDVGIELQFRPELKVLANASGQIDVEQRGSDSRVELGRDGVF